RDIPCHARSAPATAPARGPASPGDAMADATDPPEFLDVQVHQAAGPAILVALDGGRGLEGAEPVQAVALEHPRDRRPAEPQGPRDLGPGPRCRRNRSTH